MDHMNVEITVLTQGVRVSMSPVSGPHHAIDVLLPAGKSASAGLEERAEETEWQAERLHELAAWYRQAAVILAAKGK